MYEELMYLQVNKYQISSLYIDKASKNYSIIALVLATLILLVPNKKNIAEQIKFYYSLYSEFKKDKIDYHQEKLPDECNMILDIVSYRYNQPHPNNIKFNSINGVVYRFDSIHDIENTNNEQIIRWFIHDIIRWNNEITDGSLV